MNPNVAVMPADTPALDAYIDARIGRWEGLRPKGLQLTVRQKCVVALFVAFMVVSLVVWYGGFTAYRNEIDARLDGNCQVITKVRNALQNVLDIATAPRSTMGVTDAATLERIEDLNRQLLAARKQYAPAIAALTCST